MVGYDLPGLVGVRRINDGFARDEVFLALRVADSAEVAVRVCASKLLDQRDRQRFLDEIDAQRAVAGVAHLMVPHDAGVTGDGLVYVVTDYCVAGSLHDHIVSVGRFTPPEVRRIGAKLAGALAVAHERGVYHRNIKPANVLFDASGEPALTDFALVTVETADRNYAPPATPRQRAYAAPEAYLPELMTAEADIYALGATLYAMLAGWAPRARDPLSVAVDGENLVDLPKVPWALMTVIRQAMALDPQQRLDALELRSALLAG